MKIENIIESENIFLRSLDSTDASLEYLRWLSDPSINAFLEVRFNPPRSTSELAHYIADISASSQTFLIGIFLKNNNRHIGNLKLGPIDWNHLSCDLGFLIGSRDYWGKGYASKAIVLISDYAFDQLGIVKLTAGCCIDNKGSYYALLKAGFKQEGRRISQWQVGSSRQDGLILGRLNPAFEDK